MARGTRRLFFVLEVTSLFAKFVGTSTRFYPFQPAWLAFENKILDYSFLNIGKARCPKLRGRNF
jgi:hypothetical protein